MQILRVMCLTLIIAIGVTGCGRKSDPVAPKTAQVDIYQKSSRTTAEFIGNLTNFGGFVW